MALVRTIITDALTEIGAYSDGEPPSASMMALGLRRFQHQLDTWQADRLTLSVQSTLPIAWPSGESTQTIGPGGDIDTQRPVFINTLNYVVPGSSPAVEVTIGPMDQDSYAAESIKSLSSALPLSYFYQTSLDTLLGTIFLWPQVSQDVTLYLYAPKAVEVPVTINDDLIGPPGYQEAFMYQLAVRLMTPFARRAEDCPLLLGENGFAAVAFRRMKRPNIQPGLLGVDASLVPAGGGYNVYSDQTTGFSR